MLKTLKAFPEGLLTPTMFFIPKVLGRLPSPSLATAPPTGNQVFKYMSC